MTRRTWSALPLLATAVLSMANAHASDADHIHMSGAWIRVLPGELPAGAYVTLLNDGDQPITLRGASSPAYGSTMLHQSSTEGGMGRMAMVDSLVIPAHGKAELAPGGYHLMLMKAKVPVQIGDKVPVVLSFADGSSLNADFVARPANATDATH